ncbi:hypothetical protein VTJ49DRAFT_5140 [Mycothermus thermophilus]|uniref:Uncharacterized protein n=1 Tax=Humicola insolens TaxID=85995 RepID=A0ABR3V3V9_HUMIN
MRLINVKTRKIHDFTTDAHTEPYAILSHTWGDEEVSFEDFQTLSPEALSSKKGYTKIDYCCKQAEKDGYICCIDKRSNTELSEAINSMFRWYQQAAVCYAYLIDVDPYEIPEGRGLELLAPREIIFYVSGWTVIGSRTELFWPLVKITRIPSNYLCGEDRLASASVGMRMSWASKRRTTRVEDMAYCLLSIFDVNMPLLYGEGKRAFRRLQEEILKSNPMDHTLFCIVETGPWNEDYAEYGLRGLFADSPRDFRCVNAMVPWRSTEAFYNSVQLAPSTAAPYPTLSGPSVVLALHVASSHNAALGTFHWQQLKITQPRPMKLALLLVENSRLPQSGGRGGNVILPLYPWGHGRYGRTEEIFISRTQSTFDLGSLLKMTQFLRVEPRVEPDLRPGDFVVRRWGKTWSLETQLVTYNGSATAE